VNIIAAVVFILFGVYGLVCAALPRAVNDGPSDKMEFLIGALAFFGIGVLCLFSE